MYSGRTGVVTLLCSIDGGEEGSLVALSAICLGVGVTDVSSATNCEGNNCETGLVEALAGVCVILALSKLGAVDARSSTTDGGVE